LDLDIDEIGQLEVRELQHFDRLLQLWSHDQRLRLTQLKPRRKTCHVHIPLAAAALISATCSLRTSPSVIVTASIAVTPPSHDTLGCILANPVRPAGGDARDERVGHRLDGGGRSRGRCGHPSRIEPCPRWIPLSQG